MKNIFKSMSRKTIIISSSVLVGVTAFAIAIPVAISNRNDSNPDYEVKLANANGARYFVTKINPKQMVPEVTVGKSYWDIRSNDDDGQDAIAADQGLLKEFITGSVSNKNDNYENGLGKLFYDLINAKDNGPVIILKFGTKIQNVKPVLDAKGKPVLDAKGKPVMKLEVDKKGNPVMIDANIHIDHFTSLNKEERKVELKRIVTKSKDSNPDPKLYRAIKTILMAHGKNKPVLTSDADILAALKKTGVK